MHIYFSIRNNKFLNEEKNFENMWIFQSRHDNFSMTNNRHDFSMKDDDRPITYEFAENITLSQ